MTKIKTCCRLCDIGSLLSSGPANGRDKKTLAARYIDYTQLCSNTRSPSVRQRQANIDYSTAVDCSSVITNGSTACESLHRPLLSIHFPNLSSRVKLWATAFNNKLFPMLNGLSGFYAIDGAFNKEKVYLKGVQFREVEPQKLVERMAQTLSKKLSKKMDALWNLVDVAEKLAKNYTYNAQLKKGQVHYYNSKTMKSAENDPPTLVDSVHFKQPINFNFSSVHIPVEIYDGDTEILNGLQWTAALDEQFRKNFEEDNEMLWQFFGSQSGFMRTYPASVWNTHNDVDLFDVRRQSWYTQGSSSPKDMMILIDTSGSTHGQALQLMKNAVKSILDTLGENDFVNIVEFNQEADFVSDCFNHTAFVQANYRNKKQLEKDVEELKAQGQADYQVGLRFAFQKFKEFSQNRSDGEISVGANCNKVIILLTDGGTDNAEDVFEQYNWPNKTVRVFTYAVGPTATPVAAIRWMACANRGYFSQIPAMGAIRARVQDYLVVMGRPLALAHAENTQWTSGHKSVLSAGPAEYIPVLSRPQVLKNAKAFEWGNIYKDHLGLGMMTTVTLPVYNRTQGSSNQTILGVMGIDVPTTELGKHTPYVQIGPLGYSFAINPNGYAVFHPNLKRTGRYMKDPPNIDLMELELEKLEDEDDEKLGVLELRNKMIEGYNVTMEIKDSLFLSANKKYVALHKAIFAFTNITNTTFRLGLSLPDFQRRYPYFPANTSLPVIDLGPIIDETASLHIAPWEYFGTLEEQRGLTLNDSLASLVAVLKSGKIQAKELSSEQLQMLHLLALCVKASSTVKTYGSLLRRNSRDLLGFPLDEVPIHFMAFNGGLTIVYPAEKSYFMENDFDVNNSTYYQRTMYANQYVIMPVVNESSPLILAARSIVVQDYNHRIGVTGVMMTAEAFRNFTLSAMQNATLMDNSVRSMWTCEDVDEVVCYVVDDGGFLVTSNKDNVTAKAGTFLGQVDPQLWKFLRSEKVYGQAEQFDFQAQCKVQKDTNSAGHMSYLVPSVSLLYETLSVSWWTCRVTCWWFGGSGVYGQEDAGGSADDDGDAKEEDCVLATRQFYLLKGQASISKDLPCDTGTRKIITQTTTQTNLMVIVAEHPCATAVVDDMPVSSEPRRISKEEERKKVCQLSRHPRKRVQSYGCYDYNPDEDDSKCDASALPNSKLLTALTTCLTLTFVCLLSGGHR
ncbi:hypothetical protein ACOMHN_063147 [Nucella lapillus]